MNNECDFSYLEKKVKEKKKEKNKAFHVRNLKVVGNTARFLLPYVIATTVTVGAFTAIGRNPFRVDQETKTMLYEFEYKTGEILEENNYYYSFSIANEEEPDNKLVLYTPWIYKDNSYTRTKREYDIDDSCNEKLKEAVINQDIEYLENNLDKYKEQTETANKIGENAHNDYYIDAQFHYLDKNDTITADESAFSQGFSCFTYFVVGGVASFLLGLKMNEKFKYSKNIKDANAEYSNVKLEYDEKKNKLKRLKRKVGDQ